MCGGGCRLKALKYFLSQKRDLLTDISGIAIVSQKRDLLTDCQWGGRTDGRTYRMTMRGEGLSCYVQLKILFYEFECE